MVLGPTITWSIRKIDFWFEAVANQPIGQRTLWILHEIHNMTEHALALLIISGFGELDIPSEGIHGAMHQICTSYNRGKSRL